MKYTVIIEKGQESGYVAQGETRERTLHNVKEAIEVYIEALMEDGLPVPIEVGKETVEIEVAAR